MTLEVEEGTKLIDAASDNGFLVATRCGGVADCRTCRMEVESGGDALTPIEDAERYALEELEERSPRHRLSCQARVLGDVTVFVPDPASMEDE